MKKHKSVINKYLPYIITAILIIAIFLVVFITKGIYPFGKNSLIWGDMHDQITAFYYHFYDSFKGSASLLVDFTTSGSINFIGVLAYYILSPISFILLLFPREEIYLAVSIVVALKILISSLTCLYFVRYYYKEMPSAISVLLAISYAFSGYSLSMYQITPWIDLMYLFPILLIGLKKVLDLEKPTWYIIVLTISFICCFYVSVMIVFFIFLASYIYLLVYKEKEERKKAILSLGISTVLSVLMGLFIIIPSYLQISVSSRLALNIAELLNSKTGPLTDKLSFFMFGGIVYLGILFLLKNHKKDKKFSSWYATTCLILVIPLIVEPINKFWHFGSYVFFPYRFGFMMIFMLIIGACQGYQLQLEEKRKKIKESACIPVPMTIIISLLIISFTYLNYNKFQATLEGLTISPDHKLLWFLLLTTLLALVGCYVVYTNTNTKKKLRIVCLSIITIVHITCNSFLYLGIDFTQDNLMNQYESLTALSKTYEKGNYYRVKNMTSSFMMNSGMVMKYHTLDHFTSLTDRNNLHSLKKLGYSSMWVKTFSKGGTLFSDAILANQYIISKAPIENNYYHLVDEYKGLNFYELNHQLSYGYFIDQSDEIMEFDNSFEAQNNMYQHILRTDDDIFIISDDWQLTNLKEEKLENGVSFTIIDKDTYNFIEQTIEVTDKQILYLEILKDLDNTNNSAIYQKFNIYINDKLFLQNALTANNNGVIDLGAFENETVNIKIELLEDLEMNNLTLAAMNTEKYEDFIEESRIPIKIEYKKNKINVKVTSDKEQILFLPVSYNQGYSVTNNGSEETVEKVFGNFIGVKIEEGENNIEFTFIPPGLKITVLISVFTLICTFVLIKLNWYQKILDVKILQTLASIIYKTLYFILIFGVYFCLTIAFMLSYFIYFQI